MDAGEFRARAFSALTQALSAAGFLERAESIARSIDDPEFWANAMGTVVRAHAARGNHRRALSLARDFPDPYWRTFALSDLATIATAGHPHSEDLANEAVHVAGMVPDEGSRVDAMCVALRSMPVGDNRTVELIDRVEAACDAVEDTGKRVRAFGKLASELVRHGQNDRAARLIDRGFEAAASNPEVFISAEAYRLLTSAMVRCRGVGEAERAVALIEGDYPRTEAITALAEACVEDGDVEAALRVARTVDDSRSRGQILCEAASVLAEAASFEEAERVARAIDDRTWKANAIARLAWSMATTSAGGRAEELAAEAETLARSVTSHHNHAKRLIELAHVVAETGDRQQASVLADDIFGLLPAITTPSRRAQVIADLIALYAAIDQPDRTNDLISRLIEFRMSCEDLDWHAVKDPLDALISARQYESAMRLIDASPPDRREGAMTKVVLAMDAAGDHDLATDSVAGITDRRHRANVLRQLAYQIAERDEYARAAAVAGLIDEPWERGSLLKEVMRCAVVTGNRDQAASIVDLIDEQFQRDDALAILAPAAAGAGDLGTAEMYLEMISIDSFKATALIAIAELVDSRQAAGFLARALRIESWPASLRTLAKAEPAAVTAIARQIRNRREGDPG